VLVLTRKTEEGIRIGNDVRIVVLSTARGHVRIGIDAPSGVSVLREEVHLRIANENRKAAVPLAGGADPAALLTLVTEEAQS
jgi:carbon storage regulator